MWTDKLFSLFDAFRSPPCPTCGHRQLKLHSDGIVEEGRKTNILVNPAWFWWRCQICGSKFKEKHYGDGNLIPVSDGQWKSANID
jgi:DNA-directed RNA polymerase subunit RPC12/RpoP